MLGDIQWLGYGGLGLKMLDGYRDFTDSEIFHRDFHLAFTQVGCLTGDTEIFRDCLGQSRTVPRRWPGWKLLALVMNRMSLTVA